MIQELKNGEILKTSSGIDCKIEQLLGSGGQGEVYKVDLNGQKFALKWYFAHQATEIQKKSLEIIINKGTPTNKFLWPMMLVSHNNKKSFGYIMPLRTSEYVSIHDLMFRKISPSFYSLITTGLELAYSYFQLHSKGLAYRDISFGNVFFEPKTGSVLICDNDNVSVDDKNLCGILGTPRFMAPEIIMGKAVPSRDTDIYSLAIFLFYILILSHPLDGQKEAETKCLDANSMNILYGRNPVFIYDPVDKSNRPVKGIHDNALIFWPLYPQFIRDLFIRSFTSGIKDPSNGRVTETEWRNSLIKLRDSIFYCRHCNNENFYDMANNGKTGNCWSCGIELVLPWRIRIGNKTTVMLYLNSKLYDYHLCDDPKIYNPLNPPLAEVTQHPNKPSIWGLKNISGRKWSFTTPADLTPKDIDPGRSVQLGVGTKINFGQFNGEIIY